MKDGVRRGYTEPETHYYLARAYHLSYNFKDALSEYEKFETTAEKKQLNKSDCKAQKLSAESGLNLMNSIKDVQVLEKTEAEKASFYRYMNIDPSIGKIISTPKELLSKIDLKSTEEHVLFLPNNGKKIFFSSKGKEGLTGKDIYMTSRVNGAFTPPVKLKSTVNTEFDEDFAFMHPNGAPCTSPRKDTAAWEAMTFSDVNGMLLSMISDQPLIWTSPLTRPTMISSSSPTL